MIKAFLFLVLSVSIARADCAAMPLAGAPTVPGNLSITRVCHKAYNSLVRNDLKVPIYVAYELTGPHSLGCIARSNNFHVDPALPGGSAAPSDYAKSGYDKGHQGPAEDFSWDKDAESDSFSMANMAPQIPGLNRQQWERLEETVRAWSIDEGPLSIYVGPVPGTKTIGKHKVNVPVGFWKVIVNKGNQALAFYMDNKAIAKGDLQPFRKTVLDIEHLATITLPKGVSDAPQMWEPDMTGWRQKHKAACGE